MPFPSSAPAICALVLDSERNIDTKSGGETIMAGVGRSGFAAAARAAMFAVSLPHHDKDTSLAMDGRRANAPQYLDINAAMSHVMRAAMTPPLSPNSGYSHSPVSPRSGSPLSPSPNITPITGQFPEAPLSSPRTMARG
ncbi:hypothetical protein K503DRAFT_805639 [Rhizopogon vinicolor AM-OR11-026]|uniref:Uncharacterized protein n=1 Tax=Rhizopogon vinicolor AM-OR11-026 TaxID=1314800 RepID=A0A1B7MH86_9AGAM|nr:hypothetical protein K503DRAFT_805639 [Rhizopogon vinicolor AM-OR11-026]